MSFFYIMDDLRFFFSFFLSFMVGGWVGLARDGCLVRSLVGVTQWGCAQPGWLRLLGVGSDSMENPTTATAGGMLSPHQLKTGKIYTNSIKMRPQKHIKVKST